MKQPESGRTRTEQYAMVAGCLLGGAIGDALGAPIEFMSIDEIRAAFGSSGVTKFEPAYGRIGAITDDTQMSLFTAEGVIRAEIRYETRGICNPAMVIYFAYLRWLVTQGVPAESVDQAAVAEGCMGWLVTNAVLHSRRSPGNTCISALSSGDAGRPEYPPINDSKGCGAVMRAAPLGLAPLADPLGIGCRVGMLTHGHPTGYISAGAFVVIIDEITKGSSIVDATRTAIRQIRGRYAEDADETIAALWGALALATLGPPTSGPEAIAALGLGWTGEEALAIGLYAALTAGSDFRRGVEVAVNHSGDSDSTGSICGNILGCALGVDALPSDLLDELEARDVIEELSADFVTCAAGRISDLSWEKYPGA